jgi:hypothetical protein
VISGERCSGRVSVFSDLNAISVAVDGRADASLVWFQAFDSDAPITRHVSDDVATPVADGAAGNPNIAYGEEFSESADAAGVTCNRVLERIIALGQRWEPARTG